MAKTAILGRENFRIWWRTDWRFRANLEFQKSTSILASSGFAIVKKRLAITASLYEILQI
jgi:hypothetical protein